MNDAIMEAFEVRPSGNIGQVVLDPDDHEFVDRPGDRKIVE